MNDLALAGALMLIVGIIAMAYGARSFSRMRWYEDMPLSTVRAAAMGPACIRGTTEQHNTQLSALSAQPFIYGTWDIRGRLTGRLIQRVSIGKDFFVYDGTGTLRVDAQHAQLHVAPVRIETRTEYLPPAIRDQLGPGARITLALTKRVVVVERAVRPNTEYYVRGNVQDNPHVEEASQQKGYRDTILTGDLFINDKKHDRAIKKFKNRAQKLLRLGVTIGVIGFLLLLSSAAI